MDKGWCVLTSTKRGKKCRRLDCGEEVLGPEETLWMVDRGSMILKHNTPEVCHSVVSSLPIPLRICHDFKSASFPWQ